MTPENGLSGPDYSAWVVAPAPPKPPPRRWCPTHRRWEVNPQGRLRCGAAWAEQYKMEREVEAEMMHPNAALIKLADNVSDLVAEIRTGGVIAEPPAKPQYPKPPTPPAPPTPRRPQLPNGKGGVALP